MPGSTKKQEQIPMIMQPLTSRKSQAKTQHRSYNLQDLYMLAVVFPSLMPLTSLLSLQVKYEEMVL